MVNRESTVLDFYSSKTVWRIKNTLHALLLFNLNRYVFFSPNSFNLEFVLIRNPSRPERTGLKVIYCIFKNLLIKRQLYRLLYLLEEKLRHFKLNIVE